MLTTLQHYYNWRKTLQRWLEAYRSKFVEVRNAEFCSQAEKLWDRKGARIEHVIKKDLRQAWFEVIFRILVLNCLYFMNMLVFLLWDKWFLRYRHIGIGYTLFWTTLYHDNSTNMRCNNWGECDPGSAHGSAGKRLMLQNLSLLGGIGGGGGGGGRWPEG